MIDPTALSQRAQSIIVAKGTSGFSRLVSSYAQTPLKLFVLCPEGPTVKVVMAQLGGVLSGDHFKTQVEVRQGSQAWLTSQATTKVYRMPNGSSSHHMEVAVGQNATLIYRPEPLVLFAQAQYHQAIHLTVESTSRVIWQDITGAGRLAYGEKFLFTELDASLQIDRADLLGPILWERHWLRPQISPPNREGLWGSWNYYGSLVIVDPAPPHPAPSWVEEAWHLLLERDSESDVFDMPKNQHLDGEQAVYGGISRMRQGWVVRVLSRRVDVLQGIFDKVAEMIQTEWLRMP